MTSHVGFDTTQAALDFIFGGKAVFTLTSLSTGTHFTYKMRRDDVTSPWFASVLNGPDTWTNYLYIGFVPTHGHLEAGRKGRPDAPSFKALAWALGKLQAGEFPKTLMIQHEGKCCVCSRRLTVPESIASGIGPVCAARTAA